MIILSPLALQNVPPAIIGSLRSFSSTLPGHLQSSFEHTPSLFRAKMYPATHFLSVLGRLLSVNATAHAAAKILAHGPDREIMLHDWQRFVDAPAIARREIPCGAAAAQKVLDEDIVHLLTEASQSAAAASASVAAPLNTEGILDKWAQYFSALHLRFPGVNPRLFILCAGSVESAALRAITMNGGEAFGAWWVVRCWLDEWIAFVAERGGFMSGDGGDGDGDGEGEEEGVGDGDGNDGDGEGGLPEDGEVSGMLDDSIVM